MGACRVPKRIRSRSGVPTPCYFFVSHAPSCYPPSRRGAILFIPYSNCHPRFTIWLSTSPPSSLPEDLFLVRYKKAKDILRYPLQPRNTPNTRTRPSAALGRNQTPLSLFTTESTEDTEKDWIHRQQQDGPATLLKAQTISIWCSLSCLRGLRALRGSKTLPYLPCRTRRGQ